MNAIRFPFDVRRGHKMTLPLSFSNWFQSVLTSRWNKPYPERQAERHPYKPHYPSASGESITRGPPKSHGYAVLAEYLSALS